MNKTTPFFFSLFLAITPVISMEREYDLQALPDPAAIIVVASCENKNALRQTCKHFGEFASRRKNATILVQPQLQLTQEALDRYLLYYGALGNAAIVRNLLARGANSNAREDSRMTLMHYAMQCGYDDIAEMLFEHSDLILTDFINSKKYPFLSAMQCHQPVIIERIFSRHAFDDGEALCYAVKNGLYTMVQDLLARNVSANATNAKGECPLYLAVQAGHINVMKLLIVNDAQVNGNSQDTPLRVATSRGYTSAVQLLIDHDADLNVKDMWNGTVLHSASSCGCTQIVKILLEKEVCVNEKNDWGNTPLHAAVQEKFPQVEIVKMLLEKEAQINATNRHDETPMDFVQNEDIRMFLMLHGGKTSKELEGNCAIQFKNYFVNSVKFLLGFEHE